MPSLIAGEPVAVLRPVAGRDELGEPTYGEPEREEVADVIVAPGSTSDLDESRPEGVTASYTLCFPKTYDRPLRGCSVVVRGETCRVVGDPRPYTPANTPGAHNYTVEVTRADG